MAPNWHVDREKNVSHFLSCAISCCCTFTNIGRWFWLAIARLRIVWSCGCVGVWKSGIGGVGGLWSCTCVGVWVCGVGDGGGLSWGELVGVIKTSGLPWADISIFSFDCSVAFEASFFSFSLSDLLCEIVRCVGSEDVGLCCLCRGRCSRASSSLALPLLAREEIPTKQIKKQCFI